MRSFASQPPETTADRAPRPVPVATVLAPQRLLALQRTAGNHAVSRWLSGPRIMRAPTPADLETLSYEDDLANERFMTTHVEGQLKSELGDSPALRTAAGLGVDLNRVLKNKRQPRSTEVLREALALLGGEVPGAKDSPASRAFDVQTAWQLGVNLPEIVKAARPQKPPIGKDAVDAAMDDIRSRLAALLQEFSRGGGGEETLGALGVAEKDRDELYSRLLFSGYKPDEIAAVLGQLHGAASDALSKAAGVAKQVEVLLPLLRRHTATAEINAEIERLGTRFAGGDPAWSLLGATPGDREWVFTALRRLGHTEGKIGRVLKARQKQGGLAGSKEERKAALEELLRTDREPAATTVDPANFPQRAYKAAEPVEPYVLEAAARAGTHGSTIEPNPYVERHFTPVLMKFLLDNPDVMIEVYEGRTGEAIGHLARAGYTELRELSDNPVTDFRKFTARNSDGAVALVVVGFPGRAYQREIAAHFVYYNLDKPAERRIDPARVRHHRLDEVDAAKTEFAGALEQLRLDPDVVLMGNVEQVKAKLGELGIEPVAEVAAPSLFGVVYAINGKGVLSLKVEPYLYADRAGSFVAALQARSAKDRAVIFTGTAGALDQSMQIGDLVAPQDFAQTDALTRTPVTGAPNLATGILGELASARGGTGVYSGEKVSHGAVDTILFEDNAWFEAHKTMTIVEQEVAGIAAVVAASAKATRLFAFFRISDVLGLQDFSHNETERPPERTQFDQGDVVLKALESVLGPLKRSEPAARPGSVAGVKSKDEMSVSYELGQHLITLYRGHMKALEKLDAKLARQLEERIPQVLYAHKDAGPAEIEQAILALYREYGVKSDVKRAMLETPFRIKYSGPATVVTVRLSYGDATVEKPATKGTGAFWTCTFPGVPRAEGKVKVSANGSDKEQSVTTGTGKATFVDLG